MKILLVNLPSVPYGVKQIQSMPMGILYLSAYLKKYTNAEVRMLDIGEETDWEPDIIGYSVVFSSSHHHFVEMVEKLKKQFPNALHIAGGNHATNACEEVGRHVDHVFLGEGELTLVDAIKNGFRGKYIKSEPMDITELLNPDWDLIDMDKYTTGETRATGAEKKSATIITSRGCPYKCTFCAGHTVHGRKLRQRSIDNVIEEIKTLNGLYGVNLFIVEDDLFLAPKSRGLELLNRMKELNIQGFELRLPSALAVKVLDEELVDALIDAGTEIFNIAIESGCEKTQKSIKKNVPLGKAKRLVKYIRSKGKLARCYFILGFPGETREDMQETIRYAIDLKADWSRFASATPLIGSEMYEQFLPYLPNNIWNGTLFGQRFFDTPEAPADKLSKLVKDAQAFVNYIHAPYFAEARFDRAIAGLMVYSQTYPEKTVRFVVEIKNQEVTYKVRAE
jgi:radical SAM superfamily enzyme YgiQ (UPF0313 family)